MASKEIDPRDIEYFDIVAGVLQGDTLAPYLFIICLTCLEHRLIKSEKTTSSWQRKEAEGTRKNNYWRRLRWWHSDTGKYTQPSWNTVVWNELHVNAHKTEYMCYNQTGDITTLDWTLLKLVDKFTYQGSSVSSTEKDINTRLTKAWTAIDRLSIIWKSDLIDKMKRSFFQAAVVSILLYGCTTWMLT